MPTKTIYKPSKSVIEKIETGTREKSQRSKTKKETYQAALPDKTKKLLKREKRQIKWTVKEKPILLRAQDNSKSILSNEDSTFYENFYEDSIISTSKLLYHVVFIIDYSSVV